MISKKTRYFVTGLSILNIILALLQINYLNQFVAVANQLVYSNISLSRIKSGFVLIVLFVFRSYFVQILFIGSDPTVVWSVENNLHWQLDYTFREDDNATTDKAAFNNFSLLNKMVLTMIKYAKPFFSKLSVKSIIKATAWNYEETASTIFSCFDEKTISEIFVNAGGRKN